VARYWETTNVEPDPSVRTTGCAHTHTHAGQRNRKNAAKKKTKKARGTRIGPA
jgi:hypothetical protein